MNAGPQFETIAQRLLRARLVRYLGAAIVGAIVDFSVFAGLIYGLGVGYLWAGVAGFLCATLANYLVSVRLVFKSGSRFPRSVELLAVYGVSATGLFWHQLILYAAVEHLAMHVILAKVLAVGLVFIWNYQFRRRLIFAPSRGP